ESVLQTTVKINTQNSTTRSSNNALGLDLTTAVSRLYSSPLGLDVTSAESVSTLQSSATLGLNLTPAQSTITSTAEMNTATTSYGSSSLTFSSGAIESTSTGTLTGTYTGVNTAAAATSLTVKIKNTSVLSPVLATQVKFEVRDQADTLLFSYNGNIKAGDTV